MAFIVISLVGPDPPAPPPPPAADKEDIDYINFAGIAVLICESVTIIFEIVTIIIILRIIHAYMTSCRRTHDQGHHHAICYTYCY